MAFHKRTKAQEEAAVELAATALPSTIPPLDPSLNPFNTTVEAAPQSEPPPARMATAEELNNPPPDFGRGDPIELSVAFSNVNIGDKTASVGISIDRSDFSILQADEYLCGHRVGATIIGRPPGNAADQGNLPMLADDVTLSSTFDVKSFSTTRKAIKCSLVCNIADIPIQTLAQFAKRNGKFIITQVAELPKKAMKAPKEEVATQEEDDDEFEEPE